MWGHPAICLCLRKSRVRTFVVLLPSKGRVCSMRGVVKATTMAGSIVHILLIPERYLPYIGSSKPLGRTVRATGARGERYKMLRAGSRLVRALLKTRSRNVDHC